jgi:hypothetical protein
MRRVGIGAVIAVAVIAGWWWLMRGPQDDTGRILAVLDEVIAGLEDRDAGDVLDHLSPDYRDAHRLTRDDVYRYLVATFLRRRAISVHRLGGTEVEVRDDRTATAAFTAAVSEGLSLDALRRLGVWEVTVELREDGDGAWRITGHRRVPKR